MQPARCICLLPHILRGVQGILVSYIGKLRVNTTRWTDERVRLAGEAVAGCLAVKMLGEPQTLLHPKAAVAVCTDSNFNLLSHDFEITCLSMLKGQQGYLAASTVSGRILQCYASHVMLS